MQNLETQIEYLNDQIIEKWEQWGDIVNDMNYFDPADHVSKEDYDQMLDDCYDMVVIGDSELYPSTVLAECDPIAYDQGFSDYVDSFEIEEFPEFREMMDEKESLEAEIEDLKAELENLEEIMTEAEAQA